MLNLLERSNDEERNRFDLNIEVKVVEKRWYKKGLAPSQDF